MYAMLLSKSLIFLVEISMTMLNEIFLWAVKHIEVITFVFVTMKVP